jgi:hypothetical protein
LAFAPANASATPVLWTINTTNDGGGTVVGSFVYDADTNLYSNIAITTTVPTATFDTSDIAAIFGAPSPHRLVLIDGFVPGANDGKPVLLLNFPTGLTNLGGALLSSGQDGPCDGADCSSIGYLFEGVSVGGFLSGQISGTPVASAVPEPATLLLCSTGLLGAGVRRWRQRRA